MVDKSNSTDNEYTSFDELLKVLDLSLLGKDKFEGTSMQLGWRRVYGGQVIAQSLIATHRTVPNDRFIHSLHCYFLRPGLPDIPLIFEVERIRDGGSITTRRVLVRQNDRPIFAMSASFKLDEKGFEHQFQMPSAPNPETLPDIPTLLNGQLSSLPEAFKTYWLKRRPFELRPINVKHYISRSKLPPKQNIWFRPLMADHHSTITKDRILSASILAYMSDMTLLDTSLFPHGKSMLDQDLQMASIDHSMWFHKPVTLGDWMLYEQESPASSRGCGTSRGQIFSREGKLVASTAQEGLIRHRELPK